MATGASTLIESTSTSASILGKRTHSDFFVLRLTSDSEPDAATEIKKPVIINGVLTADTKKRYKCTHSHCEKSYSKPSRLNEHERSHTGDRPFVCETCNKSYLRETHLQAHSRSHLPESSRPLLCPKQDCGKRFWTNQHLRAHADWHNGVKPFQCSVPDCNELFAKQSQLRSHVSSTHRPPGTKPFQCDHEGCTRSFNTNQHLRTHMKVHDERRYTCIHPTCIPKSGALPTYHPTWTTLQHHIRTAHPPTCTHPSCNKRIFSSQKGLRAHQKLHEQRDLEIEMGDVVESDSENPLTDLPRKRRRGGEIGRDWKCDENDCDKDFKSKRALTVHKNIVHLGLRDHICPHEGCGQTYGYKHLLHRHLAKAHSKPMTDDEEMHDDYRSDNSEISSKPDPGSKANTSFSIDTITGLSYAQCMHTNIENAVALSCPYPHVDRMMLVTPDEPLDADAASTCDYAFRRAYDLRRHLKAAHGLDTLKDGVDQWVKRTKVERRR